ncbi:MAG TPA: DNA-processing protein DprA [Alphaproteobacteria bacterium]|nr:DNA-processing protein DprA [Alphaproteobacteria bacterium]
MTEPPNAKLLNVTIHESTSPHFPAALRHGSLISPCHRIWAIGDLQILETRLLGFFCSARCPGNVIVQTYDLARALRDAGVPVIGGFHAPMEKECLELLLRGTAPVVVCPARGIEQMRLPAAWRTLLVEGRLLVLSPFAPYHRRPSAVLAEQRNRFAATLADDIFVAHAGAGSRTEQLCVGMMAQGKRVYTFDLPENRHLVQCGVVGQSVPDLIAGLRHRHP